MNLIKEAQDKVSRNILLGLEKKLPFPPIAQPHEE
jgi:hypothetical protein